ncbi:MAG: hypothetical protein ACIALR_13620 [Blastopirellula sp. JB062]
MNLHRYTLWSIGNRLWSDQRGVISAYALILVAVILILGAVVGLTGLRDHIVQEFGDLGVAIDSLDQSYRYQIAVQPPVGPPVVIVSAGYDDQDELNWTDPENQAPAGLAFGQPYPGGPGEDTPVP